MTIVNLVDDFYHASAYFAIKMSISTEYHRNTITRLTALWALSESGLGGMMHALKIPFTGFFLGGFAIVVITLIAHFSQNRWKDILQATLLVVLIKAAASPHSPPPAYIAVGFQGLMGAVVYSTLPVFRLAAVLFGMLALFESAIQKFLVMTLIFGKSLWEALDLFFQGIAKDLSLSSDFSFSFWLIAVYTGIYTLWGMVLGWWAGKLPQQLEVQQMEILQQYEALTISVEEEQLEKKKNKRFKKLFGAFFILLFVVGVFLIQGAGSKATYAILRTLAALLLLFYLINPLIKWLLQKWAGKKQGNEKAKMQTLLDMLPELRNLIAPAMQLAKQEHKGLAVYRAFVVNLIVLALYHSSTADAE